MRILAMVLLLMSAPAHASGDACLAAPYDAPGTPQQHRIAGLFEDIGPLLPQFPSLQAALTRIGPTVCLAGVLGDSEGYFDPEANRIVLHSGLSSGLMQGILLHELRHLDQYARGFCPSNDVSMQENARAVFALEADASAISLLAAWTLKTGGKPAAWDALAGWPTQKDIAARFAAEMAESGDAATAVAGAFGQWYASTPRIERYYVASCSDFLDRQDKTKALPSYSLLQKDFLADLCILPDSTSYACREPDRAD